MAVHLPPNSEAWVESKKKAWIARWGQVNNLGKVVERAMVGKAVSATVPVPLNNSPDVHHALPEKKRVLSISPCDESAPSGVERGNRSEGRAQKMRDAEQKQVDKKLADEKARDKVLLKARLQRAADNKAAAEKAEDADLSGDRTLSAEGLEAAKVTKKKRR